MGGKTRQRAQGDKGVGAPDLDLPSWAALTHVGSTTTPPGFVQFWERVRDAAREATPCLIECQRPDGATHELKSTDAARAALRIDLPQGIASLSDAPVVAIKLHGYDVAPTLEPDRALTRAGVAALTLRVRGFPGSPDPRGERGRFITRRIEDRQAWSLTGAVSDILCACHAVREAAPNARLALVGESLGGGLAIIVASQLTGPDAIDRLVVGVPSLGDWAWRLTHDAGNGLGDEVRAHIESLADERRRVRANLALFDAVVHARRISAPTLVKVARRDRVVPPSTVAAIYNALGTGSGHKWRFITATAHDEHAPHADLRRHALFAQAGAEFCAATDPVKAMACYEGDLIA